MATQQLGSQALLLDRRRAYDRDPARYIRAQRLCARAGLEKRSSKKSAALATGAKIAAAPLVIYTAAQGSAYAVTPEDVAGTFNKVQEFASTVTSTAGSTYTVVSGALKQAYQFVKPLVDVAFPIVQKTSDIAIKAAAPVASSVASEVIKALDSVGVNTKPVLEAGQTAVTVAGQAAQQTGSLIEGATPVVSTTLSSLLASDPVILAGELGAAVLLFLLAPGILSSLGIAARGYKGDLTAPQALDYISNSNYFLIDVRSEKEKSKSGTPSLPNRAKRNFTAIPIEELPSNIRSQLRNPRTVEAELAAIKISALKRVNKGTNLVILDSTGNISKVVAKSLSGLGFKSTWTVLDGFDGSRGWLQNRLGTESYFSSLTQVLSPSRIIPPATSKLFKSASGSSRSTTVVDVAPRNSRLLPSGE
ncbi:hypothetical protein SELMODRAFT_445878 [Selaginella moellendorffii]|uniref:Rhodanese domain-containing protein n=1 Tax=Selaginella moellendorffii TaxID=88036 RepID=D8SM14_SELML|nr:calcium sensing receptor, chloroplastic [Selaginella moellendorffii]EFJ14410.1 hypothetical protein SELMODRAFT_445878 [Selaginella moellendorffii]|eukprot:XP_002984360.1 calcium sensing receptor, chloroplastic [Selaginella moellendorffii]